MKPSRLKNFSEQSCIFFQTILTRILPKSHVKMSCVDTEYDTINVFKSVNPFLSFYFGFLCCYCFFNCSNLCSFHTTSSSANIHYGKFGHGSFNNSCEFKQMKKKKKNKNEANKNPNKIISTCCSCVKTKIVCWSKFFAHSFPIFKKIICMVWKNS